MARDDPQMNVRLPSDLKDRIERSARNNNRSMNAEIVTRLEESFDLAPDSQVFRRAAEMGSTPDSIIAYAISMKHYAQALEEYLEVVNPNGPRPPRPTGIWLHNPQQGSGSEP